jgi:hypothetical protein
MINLHSNSLPATSCGLPASLQLSALSRACHAHNRVCYRDNRLITQTVVFVVQTVVSICSVHRDLLCCRVCQHWLSPKDSNGCENHPGGSPSLPAAPAPPIPVLRLDWTNRHTRPQPQSAGTSPALLPARLRQFAGPNAIRKPPSSPPRPVLIPSHRQTLASGPLTAQWPEALASCHGVNPAVACWDQSPRLTSLPYISKLCL